LPWLQELASGLPKVAEFALSTTRSDQLARALALAKRVNGHLSSLQFARAEPSWRHAIQWGTETSSFLTTIPTTVAGCRRLLETSIRWPPHAQHRVILASSGAWYNVGEWCDILRAVPRYYGRQQRVQASPSGVCARALNFTPNHDDPIATPRPELLAGLGSGWVRGVGTYTVARRFGGTATAAEYSRDVKAFAVAADEWLEAERRRGAGSSALLWMETGERVASFQPSNRCTERHSPCARSTTALPPARGHAAGASVRIAAVPTRPDKSPNTACSSKLARMLCCFGPTNWSAEQMMPLHDAAAGNLECYRQVGNWRNRVATPIVRAHGIPVVPIFHALASKSDLHPSWNARSSGTDPVDCTHYCEPSEATLFQAQAALNAIWGALATREKRRWRVDARA
jgi:hypothetical protein